MKKLILFLMVLAVFTNCTNSEDTAPLSVDGKIELSNVEPPNWWIGMNNPVVELMIHQENIADYEVAIRYKGVKLNKVSKTDNPNYLFLELEIGKKAEAGNVPIYFVKDGKNLVYEYPISNRETAENRVQGIDASDAIYLVFPDRFANGDPSNDNIKGMQQGLERDSLLGRHGGDLQGVIDHLDYIKDLGFTAIWINPEIENDQPYESYHGYAATDFYNIDPRFGTNELYKELVEKAHSKGIKIIKDIVHNHIGDGHWWMKDMPAKNWIHQWEEFTKTTYRAPTLMDPYASEKDKTLMTDGWFDHHMPDLDQTNEHLATYLTQNNIWWVEYSGLDGFRIDTYAYPDESFTSNWSKAMKEAYPIGVKP